MNAMGKLIKAKTISFNDVILKNYKKLCLSEIDTMILMELYMHQSENGNFLSIKSLAKIMTLTEEQLSTKIFALVERGLIELLVDESGKEKFNLNGIYDQLGQLLSNDEPSKELKDQEMLSEIVQYVEQLYGRTCSMDDYHIINDWIDKKYPLEKIREGILESTKAKKMHLKYAGAIIASRCQEREKVTEVDPELKAMLDSLYVKKK